MTLVKRLRQRRVTRWVHSTGHTPHASGYIVDSDCQEAADGIERLLDLLAIIHRDGGHHTAEVGLEQSVKDAHERWGQLIQAAESGSLKTP